MASHGIRYFSGKGLQLIRQNMLVNLMAIGTITLSFLIFSVFLLVFQNLNTFLNVWEKGIQIIAYVVDRIDENRIEEIRRTLSDMPEAENVNFISREAALDSIKENLGNQNRILEGFKADILPASFEIQLRSPFRNIASIREMAPRIKSIEGISDIQYGQQWIDRFAVFMSLYRLSTFLFGVLLSVAIALIVSTAIRFSIYSRREELEVMKLVGATPGFIKIPFYFEGGLQGLIGSAASLVILLMLHGLFLSELSRQVHFYSLFMEIRFLTPATIGFIVVGGGLLGILGSFFSLLQLRDR